MGVLLKHTLRSSGRNKFQTLVVLFTVVIVTAILFISLSFSDIFTNIIINEYSRLTVDADVMIGNTGGGETYSKATVEKALEGNQNIQSVTYFLRSYAVCKTDEDNFYVYVEATDLKTFVNKDNGFFLVDETTPSALPPAIISEKFADTYGLSLGETFEIVSPISGHNIPFMVTHIMETDGFFGSSTLNSILVDIADVESMGLVNNTLIKLKDTALFDETVEQLKASLPHVAVGDAMPTQLIRSLGQQTTSLFAVALVFVIAIMLVILATSYLIVLKNRMNEMAIFKSVGATPLNTTFILLLEAVLYGVIGAVLGIILSRVALEYLLSAFLPYQKNAITYNVWKYVVAFILGTMTSIVAALPSIISYAKKSIRQLTEKGEKHVKTYDWRLVLAVTLLVVGLLIALLTVDNNVVFIVLAVLALPLLILDVVIGTPYVVKGVSWCLSKICRSGIGRLSSLGVKRNSSTHLLTVLVVVVISFSFLFVSVINIVISSMDPYNTRYDADVVVTYPSGISTEKCDEVTSHYKDIDGVTDAVYYTSTSYGIYKDGNRTDYTVTVHGVSSADAIQYIVTDIDEDVVQAFDTVNNPIIFNYDHLKRTGLKVGDEIGLGYYVRTSTDELEFVLDGTFTIVGVENTVKDWTQTAIAFSSDMTINGKEQSSSVTVLVNGDADFKAIDQYASLDGGYAILYDNWAYATSSDIKGVINLLYVLEVIFVAIAMLGILNVTVVATIDRERELYLMRISGMDYTGYVKMMTVEGSIIGISGCIGGLLSGLYLSSLVPTLASLVDKYVAYPVIPYQLIVVAVVGALLYTLLKCLVALSTKKLFSRRNYSSEKV